MRKILNILTLAVIAVFVMALANVNVAIAKEKVYSLKGEVVSVDSAAKALTVKDKKGEETIVTDEMTKIKMGKKAEALGDIKAGEKVLVKYHKAADGKLMATRILIASSKVEKKPVEKAPVEKAPAGKMPEKK